MLFSNVLILALAVSTEALSVRAIENTALYRRAAFPQGNNNNQNGGNQNGGKGANNNGGKGGNGGKGANQNGGKGANNNGGKGANANGGKGANNNGGKGANANGGKGANANGGKGANANGGKDAGNAGGNNGGGNAANTCLQAAAVQTGSLDNGQQPPVAGQIASATDPANFINFCSGQQVTNGLQTLGGSCNGIVMGKIPSNQNMISAVIVDPKPGEDKAANTDFTISVQVQGLSAGKFTNAQKTYYAAPQDLDGSGKIVGHTHVTVQDMGNSLAPTQPLDPKTFVFFKGINDAGNGQGLLSATVTGGLPAGNYRVCSMTSASNHQPVLMPVAQRGAQDDCQKFTVGKGNGGGKAAGGKAAGKDAGGKAAGGKAAGKDAKAAGKAAGGKAAGKDAGGKAAGKKAGGKKAGGKGKGAGGKGKGGGKKRRARSEFSAEF